MHIGKVHRSGRSFKFRDGLMVRGFQWLAVGHLDGSVRYACGILEDTYNISGVLRREEKRSVEARCVYPT